MHALAQLVRVISGLWAFYFAVYFLFYLTMPASAAASIQKERDLLLGPTARLDRLCHNGARACKRYITQQALYRIYLPSSMLAAHMQFSIAGISTRLFMHAPTACKRLAASDGGCVFSAI